MHGLGVRCAFVRQRQTRSVQLAPDPEHRSLSGDRLGSGVAQPQHRSFKDTLQLAGFTDAAPATDGMTRMRGQHVLWHELPRIETLDRAALALGERER